jgi:DNA-binding NtrC family response regulator
VRFTIIPNVKIAVIDEDVIIRDFVVSTLMYSVNREVQKFDNGFDAWVHFEEAGFPDIVIADVNLEEIDGLTLLKKVKTVNAKTIVVMISDKPENEILVKESGADAFLAKPFGVNALFEIVQKFVVEENGSSNRPALDEKREDDARSHQE